MPEINYLPSFYQELNAIVEYITYTLEAPRAASNLLDELEQSINNLKVFPLSHRLYRPKRSADYTD